MLDASAVLAALLGEPGAQTVEAHREGSVLSTVNLAEVMQRTAARGLNLEGFAEDIAASGIAVLPFTSEDARVSAELWPETRPLGLSLGDRACLALALRLGLPAITADRAWGQLHIGIDIQLIR